MCLKQFWLKTMCCEVVPHYFSILTAPDEHGALSLNIKAWLHSEDPDANVWWDFPKLLISLGLLQDKKDKTEFSHWWWKRKHTFFNEWNNFGIDSSAAYRPSRQSA